MWMIRIVFGIGIIVFGIHTFLFFYYYAYTHFRYNLSIHAYYIKIHNVHTENVLWLEAFELNMLWYILCYKFFAINIK